MDKNQFLRKYNMKEISEDGDFALDIIYSTNNNFTGEKLYKKPICILRDGTLKKLIKVNQELRKSGMKIKIWDAFRPYVYQQKMWKIVPDEKFVANPDGGKCSHCKGSAVDVTLVTLDNLPVKMPTDFDWFGEESYRNYYNKLDTETRKNVLLLEKTMVDCGFVPYEFEWWHFEDSDKYDIIYENFE